MFPKTTVSTLLSVIIFTGRLFSLLTFTGARVAHKRHQGYSYSYHRAQNFISAIPKTMIRHYFSIISICHPFQPSPIAKGIKFSTSSRFDVTKLKENCLDVSSTGSFRFPMPMDTHIHTPYHPYCDMDI